LKNLSIIKLLLSKNGRIIKPSSRTLCIKWFGLAIFKTLEKL